MAKISAHGATELARHKVSSGVQYLLRSDGTILVKYMPVDGWKVLRKFKTVDAAQAAFTVYTKR